MNIDDKLKEARNAAGDAASSASWYAVRVWNAAEYAAENAARSVGKINKQKEIDAQIELILQELK